MRLSATAFTKLLGLFMLLLILVVGPLPAAAPTITQIAPFTGQRGDVVTITGTGFDPDPANNDVRFGPNRAAVRSATATRLVVQVPNGQPLGNTNVTVMVGGMTSNSRRFITIARSKIVLPPNPPT